jgi:hypothetical protein
MHPYLPFVALPLSVMAAWFANNNWPHSDPIRYRVPAVEEIEQPSMPLARRAASDVAADVRVDAFLPKVPPRAPSPDATLILHSVMTGSDVDLASINGRVVQAGDLIEGYRVTRISAEGVELSLHGKTRRLPMRPLHELPAPLESNAAGAQEEGQQASTQTPTTELSRNAWATVDSPQN